jgi:hypothetical protein
VREVFRDMDDDAPSFYASTREHITGIRHVASERISVDSGTSYPIWLATNARVLRKAFAPLWQQQADAAGDAIATTEMGSDPCLRERGLTPFDLWNPASFSSTSTAREWDI